MKSRAKPAPSVAVLQRPAMFTVRAHALATTQVAEGRWTVSLDGGPALQFFSTQVEAWEAGVRAADVLDRAPSA